MAKARLRSKVVYSPLEAILKKAKDNYFAALGTTTSVHKKKYGPVFVWKFAAETINSQFVMLTYKYGKIFSSVSIFFKILE